MLYSYESQRLEFGKKSKLPTQHLIRTMVLYDKTFGCTVEPLVMNVLTTTRIGYRCLGLWEKFFLKKDAINTVKLLKNDTF